jgi:hypothetical protein
MRVARQNSCNDSQHWLRLRPPGSEGEAAAGATAYLRVVKLTTTTKRPFWPLEEGQGRLCFEMELAPKHFNGAPRSGWTHTPEGRRKAGRSKIANGSKSLLPTQDGRSLWARIRRDTYHSIVAMLGGPDMVSETLCLMARRVATLESELIFMEDSFAAVRAAGGEPDMDKLDLFGRLADRQRRLAEPLGWERKLRDTQSLDDYLQTKQITAEAQQEAEMVE